MTSVVDRYFATLAAQLEHVRTMQAVSIVRSGSV
jgi:hypothetical protein